MPSFSFSLLYLARRTDACDERTTETFFSTLSTMIIDLWCSTRIQQLSARWHSLTRRRPLPVCYSSILYLHTHSMSLHCLAILGSKNEPFYLCAAPSSGDENSSDNTPVSDYEEDVFGFLEESSCPLSSNQKTKKPSIRYEVCHGWLGWWVVTLTPNDFTSEHPFCFLLCTSLVMPPSTDHDPCILGSIGRDTGVNVEKGLNVQ